MTRRTSILLAGGVFALSLFGVAAAGPLEDGVAAYESKDYATAFRLFQPLAEQGDAVAQYQLGNMYVFGRGVHADSGQAAVWFRKAAEQGNPKAQYSLGFLYDNGMGVTQDYAQAFAWTLKAAEQGDGEAQFQVATRYEYGRGVPQNFALAAIWLCKSAEQGDTFSQDRLASYYFTGKGVPRDYVKAYMWWNIAASREADRKFQEMLAAKRDEVAAKMTPAQIAEGQQLATEWGHK